MQKRIHVLISGRVQGVAFRWVTEDTAHQMNIQGWVKNLPDGRVEVMAEAEEKVLGQFIEFLKKGPKHAIVEDTQIDWLAYTGEFESFEIHY